MRDAILLCGRDIEAVTSVTKLLYPTVAKHFKTTNQKVERAIRNAIEVSWTRGNTDTFEEMFGYKPKIEAIHAGLECAVFSGAIEGLDCISIGPKVIGAHTIEEKLSISSTKEVYELLIKMLEKCI